MPERGSGWPKTWSEWVSFITSILALATGLLALWPSYVTLQRDRPDVSLALHHYPETFRDMIEAGYPGVAIGTTFHPERELGEWYVLTVVNKGNRPINIERVLITSVSRNGPGRSTGMLPFDRTLSEDKRRASFAFQPAFAPNYRLDSVRVEADSGQILSITGAEERVGVGDHW